MLQPKVSVIVPVYNVESYLRQCLESILNQTMQEIEIIVMDDGSTDSSPAIIDYYARQDSRVVAVYKENEGYGATLNRGFGMATGEFVGIVESDDFIDPQMYEELYAYAQRLDADVVKGPFRDCFTHNQSDALVDTWSYNIFDAVSLIAQQHGNSGDVTSMRGTMLDNKHRPYPFNEFLTSNMPKNRLYSLLECPCQLATHQSIWAGIYRLSYLKDNNIRFDEVPGAGHVDIKFCLESLLHTDKLAWLDTMFYNYRVERPGSSTEGYSVAENAIRYREMQDVLLQYPDVMQATAPYLVAREAIGLFPYYRSAEYTEDDLKTLQSLFADFTEDQIARAPLIDNVRQGEVLECRKGIAEARHAIKGYLGVGTVVGILVREVTDFGWFQLGILSLLAIIAMILFSAHLSDIPLWGSIVLMLLCLLAVVSCLLVLAFPLRRVLHAVKMRL